MNVLAKPFAVPRVRDQVLTQESDRLIFVAQHRIGSRLEPQHLALRIDLRGAARVLEQMARAVFESRAPQHPGDPHPLVQPFQGSTPLWTPLHGFPREPPRLNALPVPVPAPPE